MCGNQEMHGTLNVRGTLKLYVNLQIHDTLKDLDTSNSIYQKYYQTKYFQNKLNGTFCKLLLTQGI